MNSNVIPNARGCTLALGLPIVLLGALAGCGSAGGESAGTVADENRPTAGSVLDGTGGDDVDFQAETSSVTARWSGFADAESGLAGYDWAIGSSSGSDDVRAWSPIGLVETMTSGDVTLSPSSTYFVSVRARDRAGNVSEPASSDGVTVDVDGPRGGVVRDGEGDDINTQTSTTTISANWLEFSDDGSGLAGYRWAIGTDPSVRDVQNWVDVGLANAATATGLRLVTGQVYYVFVQARDQLGHLSGIVASNGVTVTASGGGGGGTPPGGGGGNGSRQASFVSQHGITWRFDRDYEVGEYANGDHWVKGPVRIVQITPESRSGSRTKHGTMINPAPGRTQGYDSGCIRVEYRAELNAALDVSASSPLEVSAGSSLVSTISRDNAGVKPQQDFAAILTVVGTAPAGGSFRPPYCGSDKTSYHNVSNIRWNQLGSLGRVSSTPAMSEVAGWFERPWIDHVGGWTGQYIHPQSNMPHYGRDMSSYVGVGALMLHLDFTNTQKEELLIRYLQLGIDLYGITQNGGQNTWYPDGGHASGRKWPILFAGIVLDDSGMKGIGSQVVAFGEDDQTFYVEETSPGVFNGGHGGYTRANVGMPEWGVKHSFAPQHDRADWWAVNYRTCCTANAWVGFVLSAHIMNAKGLWNHNALFDYQDRYMQVARQPGHSGWMRSWSGFAGQMWDTYRSSF